MLSGTFDDFATRLRSENGIQITAKQFNLSIQLSDEWQNRQSLLLVFKFHEGDASAEIPVMMIRHERKFKTSVVIYSTVASML